MTIRSEMRPVFITPSGHEFPTLEQAEAQRNVDDMTKVLDDLDVCWRDVCPSSVAEELQKMGFLIVRKE